MTDFTDTIEAVGEQTEALSQDLEAHLDDLLGLDVTVDDAEIRVDDRQGGRLLVDVELDALECELERRLDADDVWIKGLSIDVRPTDPDEPSEIEEGVRSIAREEAQDIAGLASGSE
ncbi:hypothetical protein EA472_22615 [Natrarchaeobius oligotrophus]|uniref:Uncharacterized protein n=2 Tax=Natrarchaeobius TaxID=2501796 RepID=A0A3N6MBC2_NATCH|nr:hypothetical protein EA472_22615 [Natrarchaeobius chitinivorans]